MGPSMNDVMLCGGVLGHVHFSSYVWHALNVIDNPYRYYYLSRIDYLRLS